MTRHLATVRKFKPLKHSIFYNASLVRGQGIFGYLNRLLGLLAIQNTHFFVIHHQLDDEAFGYLNRVTRVLAIQNTAFFTMRHQLDYEAFGYLNRVTRVLPTQNTPFFMMRHQLDNEAFGYLKIVIITRVLAISNTQLIEYVNSQMTRHLLTVREFQPLKH